MFAAKPVGCDTKASQADAIVPRRLRCLFLRDSRLQGTLMDERLKQKAAKRDALNA
jgi:hypothetical protein